MLERVELFVVIGQGLIMMVLVFLLIFVKVWSDDNRNF